MADKMVQENCRQRSSRKSFYLILQNPEVKISILLRLHDACFWYVLCSAHWKTYSAFIFLSLFKLSYIASFQAHPQVFSTEYELRHTHTYWCDGLTNKRETRPVTRAHELTCFSVTMRRCNTHAAYANSFFLVLYRVVHLVADNLLLTSN